MQEMDVSNPDLFSVTNKDDHFQCNLCTIIRKKGQGYTNLISHLEAKHSVDDLIDKIPEFDAKIGPDANVIHSPLLEKAIIKLQRGEPLSPLQKALLSIFKVEAADTAEAKAGEPYDEYILRKAAASVKSTDVFRSTLHVSPTSNIVERLFSRAGLIMRPNRRVMDPSTLEMLLMLRLNKDLWSAETLQIIFDRKKDEARVRAEAKRKAAEEAAREEAVEVSDGEMG
jgi:hypothetical protein